MPQLENLVIYHIKEENEKTYMVSIMDIVEIITAKHPEITIVPLGEVDFIIQYFPENPKTSKIIEWGKVFIVCLIVFAGSTVAIMTYQVDTSLAKTFTILNKVFTGEIDKNPLWITIPYTIGMPVGAILFFIHFGTKAISDDPAPIEVEIDDYEDQVETTVIDNLTTIRRDDKRKRRKEK